MKLLSDQTILTFCMTSKIRYPLSLIEHSAVATLSNHSQARITSSSVISGTASGDQYEFVNPLACPTDPILDLGH